MTYQGIDGGNATCIYASDLFDLHFFLLGLLHDFAYSRHCFGFFFVFFYEVLNCWVLDFLWFSQLAFSSISLSSICMNHHHDSCKFVDLASCDDLWFVLDR